LRFGALSAGTKSLQCGHLKPRWRSVWPAINSAVNVFLQWGHTISCAGSWAGASVTLPRYRLAPYGMKLR